MMTVHPGFIDTAIVRSFLKAQTTGGDVDAVREALESLHSVSTPASRTMSPSMKNLVGLRLTSLPADSQRERKKAMSMKTGVSSCLLTLALGSAHFASPAMAQESAKWFVLRHDQTGSCWTALLISIDGDYRHAVAQKAGGPYDSKAEALKREKELETKGVCSSN